MRSLCLVKNLIWKYTIDSELEMISSESMASLKTFTLSFHLIAVTLYLEIWPLKSTLLIVRKSSFFSMQLLVCL